MQVDGIANFRITYDGGKSMNDFEIREVHIEDAERVLCFIKPWKKN